MLKWLIPLLAALTLFACAAQPNRMVAPDPGIQKDVHITIDSTMCPKEDTKINLNSESEATLSANSFISEGILYHSLFAGLSVADVKKLRDDMVKVETQTDIRTMSIFINSPGGDAFSGLAIADIISQKRDEGWIIAAYGNGIIASAAVPIFSVCRPRTCTKGTIFMVHEAALWKWPGRETSSDIRAQNELMVTLQDLYLGYMVRHSKLTLEEWKIKEKMTTWFGAEAAKEWGIVDFIK